MSNIVTTSIHHLLWPPKFIDFRIYFMHRNILLFHRERDISNEPGEHYNIIFPCFCLRLRTMQSSSDNDFYTILSRVVIVIIIITAPPKTLDRYDVFINYNAVHICGAACAY